jgi:hypothetical protein
VATTLNRYAAPVPSAISVNMLSRRLTSEAQPRWKNGNPPHSTTGVASASCTQIAVRPDSSFWSGVPGISSEIMKATIGAVITRLTPNRRVMSTSSGFTSSPAVTTRGSRAIPQIGQLPGAVRTISGCIGHTYSVPAATGGSGSAGFVGAAYLAGSARNRSWHFWLQNQYVVPSCSADPPFARPGVTVMPQTGSFVLASCSCRACV